MWAHSAFSQVVILALANPKNWILATNQAWNNFIHYPSAWIPLNSTLILSTSQMEKLNFIQLSDPKLNFIPLSGKSAVGQ